MKTFYCDHCGFVAFFENAVCGNCGSALGFVPEDMDLGAFAVEGGGRWRRLGVQRENPHAWRPCRNYIDEHVCNWMVRGDDPLCCSCRHTEIVPALRAPGNRDRWYRLESAKRRLFYSLYQLGLPVPERGSDGGLGFRFLEEGPEESVANGHAPGVIAVHLADADDATRAARRARTKAPYRTLLGELRHEIGRFYWDLLVAGSPRLEAFRALFGDERRDHAEASAAYHRDGPPADWRERYISPWAAMHPREDWAETWAHYLHVIDGLDTAAHWGFALHSDQESGGPADLPGLRGTDLPFREALIEQWLPLSQFLNSMGRGAGFGQGDAYPSVVAPAVLDKMCFVNDVVAASRVGGTCGYGTDDDTGAEGPAAADAAKRPVPDAESPVAGSAASSGGDRREGGAE